MTANSPSPPGQPPRRSAAERARRLARGVAHVVAESRRIGCFPFRPLVVFDVGANDGSSFLKLARALPWMEVYAFEPTPQLASFLERWSADLRNYRVIRKAVGEVPGSARFNVAGQGDWGCSSLLPFSNGLETTWPGRTDFRVTETIDVEVIRLDGFVASNGIRRIDFLHVDAQGADLQVLRSLGDSIGLVLGGVIEVPQSDDVRLYQGQHTRAEALDFLDRHGFEVRRIVPQQNEENLYFRRRRRAR